MSADTPFPQSSKQEVADFIDLQKKKFGEACTRGDGAACYEFARLQVSADKDPAAAARTLERACSELSNSTSCGSLAALLKFGEGVPKDEARAAQLYSRACTLGNRSACHIQALAQIEGSDTVPKDEARGVATLSRLCAEHDISESCFFLAHHLLTHPATRDPAAARPLLTRACDNGHAGACQHLAVMFKRGDGVERDKDSYLKYAERAFTLRTDPEAHTLYTFREQRKTHPELYDDGPGQAEGVGQGGCAFPPPSAV